MIRCINKAGFTSSVNLSFEADWPRATIDDGRIASVMKDALNCKVAGYTPPKGGTSHDACDPDYLNILDFFTNAGLQDKLKRDRNVFKFWGGESVVGATWGINSPKLAETRFYYDPAGKYRVTVIVEGTAGIPSISESNQADSRQPPTLII